MSDVIADARQRAAVGRAADGTDAHSMWEPLVPAALFVASAAFVVWRNSEVGVLVDISYVLNTATRIALGDVPYSQFPLAQAPGEFVLQALLIKIFGAHYAVQIAHAAIVGGIATALTYTIAARLLAPSVRSPRALAAVLAIALVPLGVYAIYPHPFYDSDACVLMLAGLAASLSALDHGGPRRPLVAGAFLATPVFMKQNVGGAFLALIVASLAIHAWRVPQSRPTVRRMLVAAGVALAVEIAALQLIVGVDNYIRWAWTFALSGRGVALERIASFAAPLLVVSLLAVVLRGASAARRTVVTAIALGILLVADLSLPAPLLFAPGFFPPVMVGACAFAVERLRREAPRFDMLVPFVLLGTTLGVLQSQGLAGSSFGIFPFLVLAIAAAAREAASSVPRHALAVGRIAGIIALALAVSGSLYTLSNQRLKFVDVNAPGPVERSSFPTLQGLSARGGYVTDLDEILVWAQEHVAPGDGFVFLPGEDPSFFALGRKPTLPSVYFFDVATPYTPAELARIADERGLRWVFVKDRLQLTDAPPLHEPIVDALTEHATLVTRVATYRVYRR